MNLFFFAFIIQSQFMVFGKSTHFKSYGFNSWIFSIIGFSTLENTENPIMRMPYERIRRFAKRKAEFQDYNDYYRLFKQLLDSTEHPE